MLRLFLILLISAFSGIKIAAQPISIEKNYGTPGTTGQIIIPYSEGGFVAEIKGAGSPGRITILRLDTEGNVIWSTSFRDSLENLSVGSIIETREQGILVTMLGISSLHLLKLSATGIEEWTVKLGLTYPEVFSGVSVVQKSYGDLFIATSLGSMSPSVPLHEKYIMLSKLDEQGNYLWNKKIINATAQVKEIVNTTQNQLLIFADNIGSYGCYSTAAVVLDTASNLVGITNYRISAPQLPVSYFNSVWVNEQLQPEVLIFHRSYPSNGLFLVQLDLNRQVIRTDSIFPQTFTHLFSKVLAKTDSAYIIGSAAGTGGAEFVEWPFNGGAARGLKLINTNGHYSGFSRTPDGSLYVYGYHCMSNSQSCQVSFNKSEIATTGNLPLAGCTMQSYQTFVEPANTDIIPLTLLPPVIDYPLTFSSPLYIQLAYTVSPVVNCSVVSVDASSEHPVTMVVWPNPAEDFVLLDGQFEGEDVRIECFSMDGKLVQRETQYASNSQIRFFVQSLNNGSYLLTVTRLTTGQVMHTRLMVFH
ncbi:MAG: T9SS type A sorting domain-containing protein [Bacteroidetes bacterium]|nr:T9SS type A sorting domain-containing protein [Bacteroidota bacterium]